MKPLQLVPPAPPTKAQLAERRALLAEAQSVVAELHAFRSAAACRCALEPECLYDDGHAGPCYLDEYL